MVLDEHMLQKADAPTQKTEKPKGYYISSLLIIAIFVGASFLGYFLGFLNVLLLSLIFSLFFTLTIVIIKYGHHLEPVRVEKWGPTFRKYSHLAGGLVMIFLAIVSPIQLSWIAFSFFLMFLIHEYFYVKKHIDSLYTKSLILIGRMGRQSESSEHRKPFYPTMWLLGAISVIGLFGQMITIAAIITFALGDSFSTIIGERLGKHKLPYNKTKSIVGSIVFFLTSFVGVFIAYYLAGQEAWVPALIAGSVGTIVESLIPTNFWLDDNFVVPVSVGGVLFLVTLI